MSKTQNRLKNKIASKKSAVDQIIDFHQGEEEEEETTPTVEPVVQERKVEQKKQDPNYTIADQTVEPDGVVEDYELERETDDHFWTGVNVDGEPVKRNKVLTTFYMDADLNDVVDELYKKNGKGFKSKLINESLRFALKEKGLI